MGVHGSYYYYPSVITASHSPMFKVFQNNLHTFSENEELKRTASRSTPLDNSRLLHSKDPIANEKNCGVVFKIQSKDCERGFVRETARNFRTRLKEQLTIAGECCLLQWMNTSRTLDTPWACHQPQTSRRGH